MLHGLRLVADLNATGAEARDIHGEPVWQPASGAKAVVRIPTTPQPADVARETGNRKKQEKRAFQPLRPDTGSCCQRLSSASLQPATAGSLGMDVASSVAVTLMTTQLEKVPTGIKGPIIIDGQPMGALLLGRSSATMLGLFVLPGVIDADFTGEVCVMVYTPFPPIQIEKGQRIVQLVPLEQMTKSLPPRQSQSRGERGFGSTGGLTLLTINLNDWPKRTVIIEYQGGKQTLEGLLDTGADSSIISPGLLAP
uniref:Uncharacterized protein n=1 Tax=Geospiza parvula TaxID=87175 RepID=A0A8C3NGG2_GEOPR